MILIIKHIDIEGPGTFGDFLIEKGEPFRIVELRAGEKLPANLNGIKAVVVLGGPMNVYEEDKYPFLKEENAFIQRVLDAEIPYFGICLGSQLLAKAAGSRVVRSPVKEIGWYTVKLTPDGQNDPFFKGFREDEEIYHWHGDMFEIPNNGALLASGTGCPHQAFRVGKNAYGIQFHVEVTDKSIKEWCDEYSAADLPGRKEHGTAMLNGYAKNKEQFNRQAFRLYENFLKIIRNGELLQQHIERLKQSIEFFSNVQKQNREKWVVQKFLSNLGIVFSENELVAVSNEPPDVEFGSAHFEVKEMLDDDRKRDAEFKQALEKAMKAKSISELWESYTPHEIPFEKCVDSINKKLQEILYSPAVCKEIDLLFYINPQDADILFPENLLEYSARNQEKWSKWRSLSFVTNNNISGVLFAQDEAPDFIKSINNKLVKKFINA